MSKMDNLRAMREARYAEAAARSKQGGAAPRATRPAVAPDKPVATKTAKAAPKAAPTSSGDAETATEELCGHRNMSGRTCTREKGHAAKSHRYS
jgi:hypothetical protein